jgi:cyclopropane-fatty-acyl-phospholipid synthase
MNETTKATGASPQAIQAHYDTGNAFYELWLDPTRTYSCALWDDAETLEEAQIHKVDYHIEQSGAAGADRVLDIGCGWGSVLKRLTNDHSTKHAVGLTLSEAQLKYVDAQKLEGVDVRLESWADHTPPQPYDAIISIGALEHFVRPETSSEDRIGIYRHYFERCRELLRPGGLMSLQTMAYGGIGRFKSSALASIFPESDLPRLSELGEAMERKFEIVRMRNDPQHYADTVRVWLDSMTRNREEVVALVGEERTVEYEHFLYSGIKGYEAGVFNLYRFTLRRVDIGD